MTSIDIFPWNDNFNTGIAQIDGQHHELVQLINLLAGHLAFQADIPALNIIFDKLTDYAAYHFHEEEMMWQQYFQQAQTLVAHKQKHSEFLISIYQLRIKENLKPETELIRDILVFLTRWLVSHILENDRFMAMVVLAMETGLTLEQAQEKARVQIGASSKVLIDIILSIYESLSTNTLQLMQEMARRRQDQELLVKLSLAVAQSPVAIVITNLDGNIEFVNDAFVTITGYQASEVLGQNPRLLQSGKTAQSLYQKIWAQLREGISWKGELVNKRKDGVEYIAQVLISPVYQADGNISHYLAIEKDITERKKAEIELVASHQQLYSLLNSMAEGAYGVDILGNCTFANRSFLQILGYDDAAEIIGKHMHGLIHHSYVDGSPYPATECRIYAAYQQNMEMHVDDEVFWSKDGRAVPVEYWSQPIITDGVVIGAICTFVDISARKQIEAKLINSEAKLRAIVDNEPECIKVIDAQGHLLQMNPAGLKMLEVDSLEQIIGHCIFEMIPPTYRAAYIGMHHRVIAGESQQMELEITGFKGQHRWLETHAVPMQEADGTILHLAVTRDISERKQAEHHLRIAATAFESQEGMIITDADNIILRVNSAFTEITGYSSEEVIGKNPRILQSGQQDRRFYIEMWLRLGQTGKWEGEIWNQHKSGRIFPEYLTITAVKNLAGVVTHYVATLIDITQRKLAEQEIERLAFYDPLTGLANRRLLQDRLDLARAASHRSGKQSALLFIDLDRFKIINDTAGHYIGDLLLKQVAARITTCVRENDTVARIGGDEFVVMLENLSYQVLDAAHQTQLISEKILAVLNQPYQLDDNDYLSTASIGATLFCGYERSSDDLLKHSDIAMYQAKVAGRNGWCFFDPQMQIDIIARVAQENGLRKALVGQHFQLYYQLQIDSAFNSIGAEALIRWRHPERGIVHPCEFIALAEETDLILAIGQWVLETACAQLKAWQTDEMTRDLLLSVNVSAKQFFQTDFVQQVHSCILRNDINPMLLKLELTESLLITNIENTIATMTALGNIGVQFSLDDFGTGYSSLQYLKKLPLSQLKIDQSFIQDITVDSGGQAIVRTILAMAGSLNLSVIAEGVETEEQREFLLENGCIHYQGFLFSKPVPLHEFEALLATQLSRASTKSKGL